MKKLSKPAILQVQAFASQLFPAILGVLAFMLLVRNTSAEIFGQFTMYLTGVGLFEMIKSGGLQSALVMRLSGCDRDRQTVITGSAYLLGGILSAGLSLIFFILYASGLLAAQPGLEIFCGWYGCLGLFTLPIHIAEATAVARQDIRFLLWLRILQSSGSLFIAIYAMVFGGSLKILATIHLFYSASILLVVLLARKTNPLSIRKRAAKEVKELFQLVRYTLATLAATNVLKSADTFLIGSFLGPKAVAAYAVPLKLTELFEIPLRSLSTTAFPQLAGKHNAGDAFGFRKTFTQYLSWSYLLFIPALTLAFVFAPYLVVLFGGESYAFTAPVFQVFVLYGLLLPLDRLTGISLDSLQQPKWNLLKVLLMASVNIAGDAAALYFGGSLEWLAFASVLNAATGAIFGLWMLKKLAVLTPGVLLTDVMAWTKQLVKRQTGQVKGETFL